MTRGNLSERHALTRVCLGYKPCEANPRQSCYASQLDQLMLELDERIVDDVSDVTDSTTDIFVVCFVQICQSVS